VEFVEDRDTIRQKTVQILQDLLKEEEAVDAEIRKKISSQKKEVLEGSESGMCSTASTMRKRCAAWASCTSRIPSHPPEDLQNKEIRYIENGQQNDPLFRLPSVALFGI